MSPPLRQLAPVLRRLRLRRERRPRPPSSVTALDLDGSTLRVVQAGPRGSVPKVFAETLELATDADRNDPVVMGVAVAKALVKLRLKPAGVVMGVPRAKVVLRTLIVPVIEKLPELASVVHLQVGKDLPFRMDEAVVDFKVRGQVLVPAERPEAAAGPEVVGEAAGVAPRLEVLVAAVKREVVEFYQRLAEAAGLQIAGLGLLPYANARCVEECHVADGDAAFALVSLRPDEAGIDIIAQRSLLFSRGAVIRTAGETPPSGEPAAPSAEAFVRSVVIEVVRSLHGYSGQEASPAVAKVVVTGATGHEADVAAALGTRLSSPCELLDPTTALALPPGSREHAAGSIGALGLAFGLADVRGLPFDFLKPKRPAVQRDLRKIRILSGLAASVVVLAAVFGLRAYLVGKREAILAAARAELADAEKKRPVYRKMIQQAGVVDDWIKADRDWLVHYAYLTSVLPPSEEVYLTSLAISGQGSVRLAVQARSGETLARLDKRLREAGYDVKPVAITPGPDRFGYEFRSTVELTVPDKLKIDLHKVRPAVRPIDDVSLEASAYKRGGA